MKQCSKCKIEKTFSEFHTDKTRTKPTSWCKACSSIASKNYYVNNREKAILAHKLWVGNNKVVVKLHKARSAFGITDVEYYSLADVCTICGSIEKLCIDHSHQSGRVRGRLCTSCNKGLGFFKDNPTLLLRASDYIMGLAKPDIFDKSYEAVEA